MTNKYIDIDSTFRDIKQYPDAGNFVARVNTALNQPLTAFNSINPVSSSFPYDTGIPANVVTEVSFLIYTVNYYFLRVPLSLASRLQANFYVGSYINFPYAIPVNGPYGLTNETYFLIVGYLTTGPNAPFAYCIPATGIVPIVAGTYAVYAANYVPSFPLPPPPVPAVLYGTCYFIRSALPTQLTTALSSTLAVVPVYDQAIVASTSSTVTLAATASSISGTYVGSYLFIPPAVLSIYPFFSGTPPLNPWHFQYQFFLISAYNGTTKIATLLSPPLLTTYPTAPIPPGPPLLSLAINGIYEICPFSYDQYASLQYLGTEVFSNPRCCNVTLTNLTLPANLPLLNTNGGTLTDLPFLWVELSSEKGNTYQQQIISANKASKTTLFKCSITPNFSSTIVSYGYPVSAYPFLNLCPLMGNQTVNFRLNDDMRFRVLLPNGEPISFNNNYFQFFAGAFTYFPGLGFPVPPDPRMQVQATFNVQFGK